MWSREAIEITRDIWGNDESNERGKKSTKANLGRNALKKLAADEFIHSIMHNQQISTLISFAHIVYNL